MDVVRNAAKVEAGATVAVFGDGAVGMALSQSAPLSWASNNSGIDVNPMRTALEYRF